MFFRKTVALTTRSMLVPAAVSTAGPGAGRMNCCDSERFRSRGPRKRRVGDTLYFVSATSMATALLKQTKGLPLVARKLRIYSSPADIEPARRELHAAVQQVRAGVDAEARLMEAVLLLRAIRESVEEAAQAERAVQVLARIDLSHR